MDISGGRMSGGLDKQKAYYNKRWEAPEYLNWLELRRGLVILKLVSQLGLNNPKILDLGCGRGWFTSMLAKIGPTVGIDLSEVAIEKAKELYPDAHFVFGDILEGQEIRDEFDIVVSMEVIEHVEDQAKYLAIAHNRLRKGGFLILTTPNAKIQRLRSPEEHQRWGLQPIENWLTTAELAKMLAPIFKVEKLFTILPGYGSLGIMRILNSYKFNLFLKKIGLNTTYIKILCRLGFGLHIVALGQKR